jgi:hypothetical protein
MNLSRAIAAAAVAAGSISLVGCDGQSGGIDDMCGQAAEAAHYIAAMSGSISGVPAVVNSVVAERKYPALSDKRLGLLGMVVVTQKDMGKSPDEISAVARRACESGGK